MKKEKEKFEDGREELIGGGGSGGSGNSPKKTQKNYTWHIVIWGIALLTLLLIALL